MRKLLLAAAAIVAMAGGANAAEHEVQMLNKSANGRMVFEPAFIRAAPGDTIRFVPTDKGHNAEIIKGMFPDGAEPFKGAMNKEVSILVEKDGVYGVKCAPHYGMGMVALVVVGEPVNAEAAQAVKHPGKAKTAFADLFSLTVASK
jgi:pseudoazurin